MTFLQATKKETGNQLISWEGGGRKKKSIKNVRDVRDESFTSDLWKESKEKKKKTLILFTSPDFSHGSFSAWWTRLLQKDNWRQVGQRTKENQCIQRKITTSNIFEIIVIDHHEIRM